MISHKVPLGFHQSQELPNACSWESGSWVFPFLSLTKSPGTNYELVSFLGSRILIVLSDRDNQYQSNEFTSLNSLVEGSTKVTSCSCQRIQHLWAGHWTKLLLESSHLGVSANFTELLAKIVHAAFRSGKDDFSPFLGECSWRSLEEDVA